MTNVEMEELQKDLKVAKMNFIAKSQPIKAEKYE
jgi:hypothetical protein